MGRPDGSTEQANDLFPVIFTRTNSGRKTTKAVALVATRESAAADFKTIKRKKVNRWNPKKS
ncbi:MAG: hypothetical protein ACI8PD_002028 [Nitrospinales bacterium]|jgi:hypothetical protein